MNIVIIMGLSGAGKTLALHKLEDDGFFCIDNLPGNLLSQLVNSLGSYSNIDKVAFCLDSRTPTLESTEDQVARLKEDGHDVKIVYLTARDDVLIKRYGESRRSHPMGRQGFVDDAVRHERDLMAPYEGLADYVFDTSDWRPSQLNAALEVLLPRGEDNRLILQIRSFGYKHGLPADADWVADVRFLANPFWIPELRPLSGRDGEVQEYLCAQPQTDFFLGHFMEMFFPLLDGYEREGKSRVLLCIGCTGGQHRSVFIAEKLAEAAEGQGLRVLLQHRDMR